MYTVIYNGEIRGEFADKGNAIARAIALGIGAYVCSPASIKIYTVK